MHTLKVIAGVLVVAGIVAGFVNMRLAPHALLLESSPERPRWLPWGAWWLSSSSAILYVVIDFMDGATLSSNVTSRVAIAYWVAATFMSGFYGFRAFVVFSVQGANTAWEWRFHQWWFNFLGSFVGWALAWPLVQSALPCIAASCTLKPTGWDALALGVAFIAVTGHLPVTIVGAITGLRHALLKLLELATK